MADLTNSSLNDNQIEILKAIDGGMSSTDQIATQLNLPFETVEYYIDSLKEEKFIKIAHKGFLAVYAREGFDFISLTDKGKVAANNPEHLIPEKPYYTSQSITQHIGTNTGQVQAIAAGGNVTATQQGTIGGTSEQITQEQVQELLSRIEELIKTSQIPSEVKENATKYVGMAKEETKEKEPDTSIVLKQLDRVTTAIKKLDTTAGAASDLISKLKPLFEKIAPWLGIAIHYFWG